VLKNGKCLSIYGGSNIHEERRLIDEDLRNTASSTSSWPITAVTWIGITLQAAQTGHRLVSFVCTNQTDINNPVYCSTYKDIEG
jgi:hypothetical protein